MAAVRFGSQRDFLKIPALGFRAEAAAVPPTDPAIGQLWTDTSVTPSKVRWWDGTKWVAADGTSIPNGFVTDAHVSPTANIALSKLATDPLARANHTGTQPASTISDFDTQVRTNRLDQLAAPTSNIELNGVRLTNAANPVAPGDVTTKSYVDNARAGISVKDPVRVVAGGNVNLASPGAAIDGVTLAPGERFLAPAQNTGSQNGLYTFNGPTSAATRTTDADDAGEVLDGSMVAVAEGTYGGYQFIQIATGSGAPGNWTQDWVVFTMGGQTYTAGVGLTQSGTTISLDIPVAVAHGGTGATDAVNARANLGALGRFAQTLSSVTAGVAYTITHGLGTEDVVASFRTVTDNRVIDIEWGPTSPTAITINTDISFAGGALRAVVIG